MERIINFFIDQGIYDENFFHYIEKKALVLPYDTPLSWFGCFPILEDGILRDIRLSVPEIVTEKNLLVNLHEFYHAYELYNELDKVYVDNKEKREQSASDFETSYLVRGKDSNH